MDSRKRQLSVTEAITIEHAPKFHKRIRLQSSTKNIDEPKQFRALLDSTTSNSKEILELIVKISDEREFDDITESQIKELISKLFDLYRQERDGDSMVRVKILDLLADISKVCMPHIINDLLDKIIYILKVEKSKNVISEGLKSLHTIGTQNLESISFSYVRSISNFAQKQLSSENYRTQKNALLVLSTFIPLHDSQKCIVDVIALYANSQDMGVRTEALRSILKLGERGASLTPELYNFAVAAMKDDYECVRREALKLVFKLGATCPDYMIQANEEEEPMRLIDSAFNTICISFSDLCIRIRVQAAEHLAQLIQVSPEYLHQTLHKQVMSNLRRKKTAHERGVSLMASGEFASGKRWMKDSPLELIDTESVSLLSTGACGALVIGLEDEFLEVRAATVDAMCKLALSNPDFAVTSLDFLVDMFNDEIEDVRIKAIYSLVAISHHIVLREDQLEMMLSSLEDYSADVREALHIMVGVCRVATESCLIRVVFKLLDVLAKYPQDKYSTFNCMRKIGQKHPNLCMAVSSRLLQDHPLFQNAELDVEDPAYLCVLILLFNAAKHLIPMISLFPDVTLKHYTYLRDAMPQLVPQLPIEGASTVKTIDKHEGLSSLEYLNIILTRIHEIFGIAPARIPLLKTAQLNLLRLGQIDPEMFGTANFLETFLAAQIQIAQLQICTTYQQSRVPLKESLTLLIRNCLKLQHIFSGLTNEDLLLVKEVCLRATALNLILIVQDRSQSALAPCQLLLKTAADISNFLEQKENLQPDEFTNALLTELINIPDPKPGRVYRQILRLVQNASLVCMPPPNVNIRMCVANIVEPCAQVAYDNVIKVTAGLIASLPFVAEINNMQESQRGDMRIKVRYPDQNVHVIVPKMTDFKKIMTEHGEQESNVRLRSTLLLSHSVWTEASLVEITLCLGVRPSTDIELCKTKILFAPKPVRRGI
ncbi:integrator complex subunit 4 [Teleopsis dalmanni]|uniref:integrator complex subunit 4 n=1 Tax=Teleopsis dalmanni TaxID=139649 RepID=UPI0018CEAA07|nr:integrator complex subunit 4 [Teleopsis dalmanni]